jgi:TonB family protein
MRNLTIAVALLAASSLGATTFESRSYLYSIAIDADPGRYAVRVTELATNKLIVDASFPSDPPVPMTATSRLPDGGARVQVRVNGPTLTVWLDVERGGMIVDSIQSSWSTKPRPRETAMTPREQAANSPLSLKYPNASRVGGAVKAPKILRRVEPTYPVEARQARVSGIVIIEALIDRTGAVSDAVVLKPLPFGLGDEAVKAVRQWQFEPATVDGQPVDVLFNLTVNFRLDEPPPS